MLQTPPSPDILFCSETLRNLSMGKPGARALTTACLRACPAEPSQRPGRSSKDNIISRAYSVLTIHYLQATAQRMRMQQRGRVQRKVILRAGDAGDKLELEGGMTLKESKDSDNSAARNRSHHGTQHSMVYQCLRSETDKGQVVRIIQ
jgi:hypothetical protein